MYDEAAKGRQKARKGDQAGASVENLPHLEMGTQAVWRGVSLGKGK